ncbi:hypothetical protein ACFPRL_32570 [Pseudoclavibacter helvolus]
MVRSTPIRATPLMSHPAGVPTGAIRRTRPSPFRRRGKWAAGSPDAAIWSSSPSSGSSRSPVLAEFLG